MADPIYIDRHRTTCIPEKPTATTVDLLVICMDDPAVTAVTVTCNGVDYVSDGATGDFILTAFGVSWTGKLTLTGLSSFTSYDWSVVQGSENDSGSCMTSPAVRDDFSIFEISCDNNTQFSNPAGAYPATVEGCWPYIKHYALNGALPLAGILHVDDHGYVDAMNFTDDFIGASNLIATNPNGTEDGVSLAWCAHFGCTGGMPTPLYTDLNNENDNLKAHWGREANRNWCKKNVNIFPQWGDHEFTNDIGYKIDSTGTVTLGDLPNERWTTYQGTEGLGALAWNAFLGQGQPNTIGVLDTHATHWGLDLGCLHITTMDCVTNGTGDWGSNDESPTQMTAVYGTNQIDDVLDDLTSSTSSFKILGLPSGIRYLQQGAVGLNSALSQFPLFNHCVAEFKRLFTDSTDSLMRNAQTNGTAANLVLMSGDIHRNSVLLHHSDEYTDNQGESIEHWQVGTVNGSANSHNTTELSSGDEFIGTDGITKTKVLYDEPDIGSTDYKRFHCVRVDVYGSENPKRMVKTVIDRNGDEVFSRQYIHSQGNISMPVGTQAQTHSVGADE